MKKVYKITCEWDTDLTGKLFSTKSAAMKALKDEDWETLVESDLKTLLKEGLVGVIEIEVHG